MRIILLSILCVISLSTPAWAQGHGHNHDGHDHHGHDHGHNHQHNNHHGEEEHKPYDPSSVALHHIADANSFHIKGDWYLPLPCMLYAPEGGWTFLSSTNKFKPHHHGNGTQAIDRYVLVHGTVMRIADANFPTGKVPGIEIGHKTIVKGTKTEEIPTAIHNNRVYELEDKTTLDGGLVGGGITSYYDFSITKNVFSMIFATLLVGWIFLTCARAYRRREGQAPKGLQAVIEPVFLFIQDEVAKPMIGHRYAEFMPFIMSLFFFILGLNLLGLIPFFPGSANVSGNISVTAVLAVLAFLVTNLNGNKHYWQHILWMPDMPAAVKLILTPVEILGIFLKPLTLMIRLFANISAGHIVILSFVGLIFLFGDSGRNLAGGIGGVVASTILTLFMNSIELLVAGIQAFIFSILTASYIGAAVEEGHH